MKDKNKGSFLFVNSQLLNCVFQGDANRSYSDEDQSSSNIEDLDQFQEVQEGSGTVA